MKPQNLLVCAAILIFALARSQGQDTVNHAYMASAPQNMTGAVIEQVAGNSDGEKAGLHQGDVVLRWRRDSASGNVESPFDLAWIEIEQRPRGTVTLEGLRDNQPWNWTMGPGVWGLTTRPNLQGSLLSSYQAVQNLAKSGSPAEAMQILNTSGRADRQWQVGGSWALFQLADALADAHEWKKADDAYQKAAEMASDPIAVAQILRKRARNFQQQHDWKQAEASYRQAMAESEKPGIETLFIARCLDNLAGLFLRQGDLKASGEQYLHALTIQRKLAPGSLDVSDSLDGLAIVESDRGDLRKAEEYAREEIAIAERLIPGTLDLAFDLNNFGYVMLRKGDFDAASSLFARALALEEKLEPEQILTASTLTNLGDIAWQQGNLTKAEEYHRRSLLIRQKVSPGGVDLSAGFNNLALIYRSRGDYMEAEKLYLQAVAILERISPNGFEMSVTLTNLGALNWYRGDLDAAAQYFRKALTIAERMGAESLHVAGLLGNLAGIAREQKDIATAREYFLKALAIQKKMAPASLLTASTLNGLGSLAHEQKDEKQAWNYYEEALKIEEVAAPRGAVAVETLGQIGNVALAENDMAKAETYYRRAVEAAEKLSPGSIEYLESRGSLASFLRRKGQTGEAARLFSQVLDALDHQIAVLGGGEEVSSNFRAMHVSYYKEYIDLLVQQKQPELAFQIVERLRARELLKVLTAHVNISKSGDDSLIEKQRALTAQIAARSTRRISLAAREHTEEQVIALDKEIQALEAELGRVNLQIHDSIPNYAELTAPPALSLKQVQESLLDSDTVLLEYDLGEERSYLWLVTSDSASIHQLPGRNAIEAVARKLRGILTARNGNGKAESDIDRVLRAKQADAEYPAAAAELSRMILGPVISSLNHKRLLVVSDGILQYIPFAALPASGPADPLIQKREIVSLPSASVLAVLKRQTAGREAAPKTAAVIADPVFDSNDPRVRKGQISPQKRMPVKPPAKDGDALLSDRLSRSLLLRSASEMGLAQRGVLFPRLLFARAEAEAILRGLPVRQRLKALDFRANRATATSEELSSYRIVHFATHGLLNSEHPELSGLVLSLVDEHGRQQNGFLNLNDIYNLKLRADVVVLSACETALGREIQGEGLVGVARGFMYAGASRVVASLWKVDDLATAEFMEVFYKAMLPEKQSPAAALRQAQIAMSKRRSSPYFWAGFVLQGQP